MAIKVHQLTKSYDGKVVLQNFSHTFASGERVCLMGPSGCGKTTLLRLLMGLETPDAGRIVGMENLRMAAVFQEDRLCMNASVASNLRLVLPKASQEDLDAALTQVGLAQTAILPVHELSGGMKRRVAILRAILAPSDILFMDEPFTGLDTDTRQQVIQYILQRLGHKTLIWVSHHSEDAQHMNSQILTLPLHPPTA